METCLLLKRKDNRKFLVKEKYLPNLIEYAKTFSSEIWKVQSSKKGMELKALAHAVCKIDYTEDPEYTLTEKIFPIPKKNRSEILQDAAIIRKFVKRRLLSGKAVSLRELKQKYKDRRVTDACLCNHLATMRKELSEKGYKFEKVGAGKYRMVAK